MAARPHTERLLIYQLLYNTTSWKFHMYNFVDVLFLNIKRTLNPFACRAVKPAYIFFLSWGKLSRARGE
jgi:hypothetical protein